MKPTTTVHLLAVLLALPLLNACDWKSGKPPRNEVSGTIETDEVHVSSRYGGRVTVLHAREGDALKSGQVIAELAAPELPARRAQMAAQLAEMEAGPRKEEIAAAKQDWEAVKAELEFAQGDEKRARELFAQKTISETERDRAATHAQSLSKNVASLKSRLDLLLAGTRPERLDQMRAQIAELDTQIAELKVVAPTNCVLEVLSVKVGDVLAPQREIATLLLTDHLWARVFVPEPWLGHIKLGQKVRVRTDSFGDKEFNGTVEQINRSAEFTPRNVQTTEERIKQVFGVKIGLSNEGDQLRAGMSVNVTFPDVPVEGKPKP